MEVLEMFAAWKLCRRDIGFACGWHSSSCPSNDEDVALACGYRRDEWERWRLKNGAKVAGDSENNSLI
jgi:hypothetical protein